jgi:DNA-binding NarL/FixJ family response regulator
MDGFVGREQELTQLRRMVAEVAAGAGGVVVIEGEQGIGKSALLEVGLAGAAEAGCRLLWSAADELDQSFPLRLMLRCTSDEGRIAPTAQAGVVLSGDPVLVGMKQLLAVVDRLCTVSPVVLVAEDLQWADEASVLMWHQLSRVARQLPLLLAGTWRPNPGQEHLARLRRAVSSQGGRVMSLGPLSADEVGELAAKRVGARLGRHLSRVIGRAGGNPLYALELADGLVRERRIAVDPRAGVAELTVAGQPVPLPRSGVAAVTDRLASLGEEVRKALQWAAVLGQEFSVTDLEIVAGKTAGELMEAVEIAIAAGVVAEAGPQLKFRYELIWQVLHEEMPASLRGALHLQAARVLAEAGAAPERVALQLVSGSGAEQRARHDWVADWLADGGSVLVYRVPQMAAELLRSVLAELARDDPRREGLETKLVTAAALLGLDDEVERTGQDLLVRSADPDQAADIAWLVARTLMRTGRPEAAERTISEAGGRPGLGQRSAVMLHALHAAVLASAGHYHRAACVAESALDSAGRVGSRIAQGYALQGLADLSLAVRHDRRAGEQYRSRALDAVGTDPRACDLRMELLASRAAYLEELDRPAEALAAAGQALAIAEQVRTPRLTGIRCLLAHLYFRAGRWDEALGELDQLTGPALDHEFIGALGISALIGGYRGDWDLAREHLRTVPDVAARTSAGGLLAAHVLLARALSAEREGGPAAGAAILAGVLEAEAGLATRPRYLLLPALARLALAAEDPALASAAAVTADQDASRERVAVVAAAADVCRGLTGQDAAPVLAAAGYYARAGRPHEQARALEDAAVLAAARREPGPARKALADAVRVYQELGARGDARQADLRLRPYGIRRSRTGRRSRPTAGWDALTPTEAKIAHLVAAGRANPDIAAELFLSRNTVQTHVSHILAKLGARSRIEIVRQVVQHPAADQSSIA